MKLRRNVGIGYNLASCFVAGMLGFEWGARKRTVSYLRCARKIWRGRWCSGGNPPAGDTTPDLTVLAAHQRKPPAGKRPGAKITELSPRHSSNEATERKREIARDSVTGAS